MYSDGHDRKKNRSKKQSYSPYHYDEQETNRLLAEERRRVYARMLNETHDLIDKAFNALDKRNVSTAKAHLAHIYRIEYDINTKFGSLGAYNQEDRAKLALLENELRKLGAVLPEKPSLGGAPRHKRKEIKTVEIEPDDLPPEISPPPKPVKKEKQILTVGDFARTVEDIWGRLWNTYRILYSKDNEDDKESTVFAKPLDYFFMPLAKTLDTRQTLLMIKDIFGIDPSRRRPLAFFMTSSNAIMTPELFSVLFGEQGIIPEYIEEFIILDVQPNLNREDFVDEGAYIRTYQKSYHEIHKRAYKDAYLEKLTNSELLIDICRGATNLIEDLISDWEKKEDYEAVSEFVSWLITNPVFLMRLIQARDCIRLIKFELSKEEYPEFYSDNEEIKYLQWIEKRKNELIKNSNMQIDRLMNLLLTRVGQEAFEGILNTVPRLLTEALILYAERIKNLSEETYISDLSEHRLAQDILELDSRLSTIQCFSRLLHTATFNTEGKEKELYEGIEQEIEQLKNDAIKAKQIAENRAKAMPDQNPQ
jgi:hypothetical protein